MSTGNAAPAQWKTRKEVLEHLRIKSHHTLQKLIDDGLPVHWLGAEMRFDVLEVDEWLRSRCIPDAPDHAGSAA